MGALDVVQSIQNSAPVQRIGNSLRRREIASMAADRLESLYSEGVAGEDAVKWAGQLRQDPNAAMAMIETYGGIGGVEAGLLNARAHGQANSAREEALRSMNMGPGAFQAWKENGVSGLKQFMEARKIGNELNNPEPVLGNEDVRALRSSRNKVTEDFGKLWRAQQIAAMADPDSPEWGQALTILVNKVLQPDSAVLGGEAEAFADSLQSVLEKIGAVVDGVWQPKSPLSREGRERVVSLINQMSSAAARDYKRAHAGWEAANRQMGVKGELDLFSRPGFERLGEVEALVTGGQKLGAPSAATQDPIRAAAERSRPGETVNIPGVGRFIRQPNGNFIEAPQ